MRSSVLLLSASSLALSAACGPLPLPDGSGGALGTGGNALPGTGGGAIGTGGGSGTGGGFIGGGGSGGGFIGTGGGFIGTGGGFIGTGGGFIGTGGTGTGGIGSGGGANTGGGSSTGGSSSGGGSATGGSPPALDCDQMMPTSGGQSHNANSQGGSDNLAWQIWSNQTSGTMTTYSVPAFSAQWNASGDFLARIGYEWGGFNQDPLPHDQTGTISAQFANIKTGTAGTFSYVGIYGWSVDPCVEWYIIEDTFNTLPFNPGGTTPKTDITVDGGTYDVYTRSTNGTGGSRCSSSITTWIQYYSIRTQAHSCGTVSISEHFSKWEEQDMPLGDLLEAKILIEAGGGSGSIQFPVANVMLAPP